MRDLIGDRYLLLGQGAPEPGGMSFVRKAIDRENGSQVAVKFVKHPDDHLTELVFEREMVGLRSLRHANIIRLQDHGQEDGVFYLVLDWIDRSLHDVLESHGPYEWNEFAETVAAPLLSALSYAHLKRIEHRDIKPRNVLIREDGTPLLADFGIAKMRDIFNPTDNTVAHLHSVPYAPPEPDEGIPWVRDVYSMGVLLIQALHEEPIKKFHEIRSALDRIDVRPDVRRLLERCIDLNPAERPANGSILLQEFDEAVSREKGARSARQNIAWLELTRAAERHIMEEGDHDAPISAPQTLLQELGKDCYAEFGRKQDGSGGLDRGTLVVVSESRKLVLKPAMPSGCLKVISAHAESYESLERVRRRAMPLGRLVSWSTTRPREAATAIAATEVIVDAIDRFRDANIDAAEAKNDDFQLFEGWLRTLDAREQLARGTRNKLAYSTCRISGKQAVFALVDEPDTDLLGEQFDVAGNNNRTVVRGEVVRYRDGELTLRLTRAAATSNVKSPGELTPFLGPTQIALQRQIDAVTAVMNGAGARPDLSSLISDPGSASSPATVEIENWTRELDDSKKQAVSAALGASDIVLVQGPPGSGKTDFIVEAVAQFLSKRPSGRVLIVSQTHVAVDNALSRLDKAGIQGLVRLGLPDDPRVDSSVKHLLLDQRMDRWANTIKKRAESHLQRRASAVGLPANHLQASLALQRYVRACDEFVALAEEVDATLGREEKASDAATGLGVVDDASTMQHRLDRLADQKEELLAEARTSLAEEFNIEPETSPEDALALIDILMGNEGPGKELLGFLELQAEWLQRVSSDRNMADVFLRTSRVIAGTCLGFISHRAVRDLSIDVCILDEASKATATEALVPIARADRSILVGDTSQLPPLDEELLRSSSTLDEYGLDREFVSETLFQRLADNLPDHSKFLLSEQYRMIRPIGDLISSCFYEGKLRSPREIGLSGYEILGKPVIWINTETLSTRRFEDAPSGVDTSYANREEVKVTIGRLMALDGAVDKGLLTPPSSDRRIEVLLIAPYRRQVEELSRRLAGASIHNLEIHVQSVDAVQGRECDIAIFSVTRSNHEGRLGFLGPDYWRRINVALSRAKFGLTIVGDLGFCRRSPGALRDVANYMMQHPQDCEIRNAGHAI
ncbi:AAA domain-containing protein [Actinoplanes sp. NPDC051343]|uniref:AAA domain-containing protein n=1 Tax=Actinoplanes sp. NPDC051343 TaxID=3363906 RepID=UPI0037A96145